MRVGAGMATMPVISSRNIPAPAKIGAAALLAFVITPTLPNAPAGPSGQSPFLLAIGQELLIGVLFGFVVQVVFNGIQMAGQLIGIQMGFNIAGTLDPIGQGSQINYVDQLYSLLAGMVFLTLNGHHQVIQALQNSFSIVPLGTFALGQAVADDLVALLMQATVISIRIGLPIAAALFLTDVAFLIIGRTAPQMNIFFVGQPVKIGVGLVAFFLALPVMVALMGDVFRGITVDLNGLMLAHG
jgi:flagellar biosynthetic protein FliR